ncbi:MAG: TonB-dependent receptor, partial [Bacteroidota bacterium]
MSLGLSKNSTAQSGLYSLEIETSTSLEGLLDGLSNKYTLEFAYSDQLNQSIQFEPHSWEGATMDQLLTDIFQTQAVEYRFSGPKKVLLRAKRKVIQAPPESLTRISGRVIDAQSGQVLPYVTIFLDTLNTVVFSEPDGRFTIAVPTNMKDRALVFQYLGYETKSLAIEAMDGSPIQLQTQHFSLREVIIEPGATSSIDPTGFAVNSHAVSMLRSNTVLINDLSRSLQMLPGIAAHDDSDASLQIRGSQGDETLIVVDGIPIQKADHFYGIFSSINGDFIDDLALYKNAFPIEYGGKTGGLLVLEGQDAFKIATGAIDLNLLTSSLNLALPLSQNIGIQIAGRTTYADASESPLFGATDPVSSNDLPIRVDRNSNRDLLFSTNPDFRFYDLNGKLYFRLSEKGQLDLNVFRAWDRFENAYELDFLTGRRNMPPILNRETFRNEDQWINTGASINYHQETNSDLRLHANVYGSRFDNASIIRSEFARFSPMDTVQNLFFNQQSNVIDQFGGKFFLTIPIDNKQFQAGVHID